MFTRLFVFLGLCALTPNAFSQVYLKETNNWYFGTNAGLRFLPGDGSSNPVALDSATSLAAGEGTAAISDTNGNLLFYVGSAGFSSNNSTVFNRRHMAMQGGDATIVGGSSSTQNAICIRQPGSFRYYYILSVAQQENMPPNGEGFYFTLVDMQGDGGLGTVDANRTSVEIIPYADEKVTAVQHRNGRDVWIVARVRCSNQFVSILLSDTGLSQPVFSHAGITNIDPSNPTSLESTQRGCMKLSPNGKFLAVAYTEPLGTKHFMQVLRFNDSSGIVSNPITMTQNGATGFGPYGVEFSDSSSMVYFSDRQRNFIYQYNLRAGTGDSASIVRSKVSIPSLEEPMTLQLGLDKRIYIARGFSGTSVAYIARPNFSGVAACGFTTPGIPLATGTTTDRGLANVVVSVFLQPTPVVATRRIQHVEGRLYPQPATDWARLILAKPLAFPGHIEVTGADGRAVYSQSVAAGEAFIAMPTHSWAPGLYTLRLQSATGAGTWRLEKE